MDQCAHEVRLQYWKNIISQCQLRTQRQTAKQWIDENGICEQTYYRWQRAIRQETYAEMTKTGEPAKLDDLQPWSEAFPDECRKLRR